MTSGTVTAQALEAAPANVGAGRAATATEIATRTLRKYVRTPQLLLSSVAATATFIVLFRYIFGGAIQLGAVSYVDYLIPGMVLTSVLITGTGTAVGVAEDAASGLVDRLRSLPVPRLALLAGRALGDMGILAWGILVTAALGFLVGFRLHGSPGQALLALAVCLASGFAFVWVFICLGLISGNAQAAQGTAFLIYPFVFVSSSYVPVDTLPGWLQPIAEHQPVSVMANAVRSLALGDPALAGLGHTTTYWVTLALIWSTGIVAVFATLAVSLFRRAT